MDVCYIHVPKTGGVSVEKALGMVHDHRRAIDISSNCTRFIVSVRDPVERAASAYQFCRKNPWDSVIAERGWNRTHCCHSSIVRNVDMSEWIRLVAFGTSSPLVDCRMPVAGHPHVFTESTEYWTRGSQPIVLRTHCLSQDTRNLLGIVVSHYNKSPNRPCAQNITHAAWRTLVKHSAMDFKQLYGQVFADVDEWRNSCRTRTCIGRRPRVLL